MTDDQWTEADDASAAFDAISADHPVKMTAMVCEALSTVAAVGATPGMVDGLGGLVTPESRPAWGDFSSAAAVLDGPYGITSVPRSWPSAPDVAYVWLMESEPQARMITETQTVNFPHTFTWVWRPELGGWRLHGIGGGDAPELLPRTSPTDAPDIGAITPHYPG